MGESGCEFGTKNGAKYDSCESVTDRVLVGSFVTNGYGLYDMVGNIMEWNADWYQLDYYDAYPIKDWPDNPTGPKYRDTRVLCGGSWSYFNCALMVANRNHYFPSSMSSNYGFRCANSP